jgi:hypothetical protein
MIKYEGIKNKNGYPYLVMSNEINKEIWIPVDAAMADIIGKYISKISTTAPIPVERKNDEPSE